MLKFPSIESYRHAVANVRRACEYHGVALPTIRYKGRVKLHGTNAGIHFNTVTGEVTAQSRERVLVPGGLDNHGFCAWVKENENSLREYFVKLMKPLNETGFTVYGEWIGPGIMKGVAINQLPTKKFVVFSVSFDDDIIHTDDGQTLSVFYNCPSNQERGLSLSPPDNVHFIDEVPAVVLDIDFSRPDEAIPELERITAAYEDCCPFGAMFGIKGIGEGLVWTPELFFGDIDIPINNAQLFRAWFKTKGEKHGNKATNNKVKVAVSAEKIEDFNTLCEQLLPEWRLNQGLENVSAAHGGISREHTGEFIKWVVSDVHKEELDVVEASEFEWKVVAQELTKRARQWLFQRV